MDKAIVGIYILTLQQLGNLELEACNNALTSGNYISRGNRAFTFLRETDIIDDNGEPKALEELKTAVHLEILLRYSNSIFD